MKSGLFFSLLALTASASIPALAEDYYKWVDRDGVTHFSENRPPDRPATPLRLKGSNPGDQAKAVQAVAIEPVPAALDTPAETALTKRQLRTQRNNCAIAKNKLVALENAGRARLIDRDSGEYRYLPDREKLAEISKMRSYLRVKCGDI